jgi:hypothetical protein
MPTQSRTYWLAGCYALTVFVSAFLVFQVQPVISKYILPWFGGAPAVWTTCMLFFQVLLFLGYAYAHVIARWLRPAQQGVVHFCLIILALCLLPITPGPEWKPEDSSYPTIRIMLLLAANVGGPYFLLSSTGPLMQAWFAHTFQGRSPYRLYALSNVGSLLALLSYPFVVEPAFNVQAQGSFWSLGFCLFALACGYLAFRLWQARGVAATPVASRAGRGEVDQPSRMPSVDRERVPRGSDYAWWLGLAALASMMLLATTNHVCQDVAVIPFLWVVPLSLYLISFVICFDNEQWYGRYWYASGLVATVLGVSVMMMFGESRNLVLETALFFAALFFICMVCHGELVRRKPPARYLTAFYLMCSGGGALGGVFVALVCPAVFNAYWETPLGMILAYVIGMVLVVWEVTKRFGSARGQAGEAAALENPVAQPAATTTAAAAGEGPGAPAAAVPLPGWATAVGATLLLGLLLVVRTQLGAVETDTEISRRNFYGVLHVERAAGNEDSPAGRFLIHGRIGHGFQFSDPQMRNWPTMYYSRFSGVGLVMQQCGQDRPLRVGLVGLGVGTLAAYGREGDCFRFYEINPDVVHLARQYFTFLQETPARVDVVLGDARLSLEREPNQEFDVLVLDAFSSDAIPVHLLTSEAFGIYDRHIRADGVLVANISNRHLDLVPVLAGLADRYGYQWRQIRTPNNSAQGAVAAHWMVLTRNAELLDDEVIQAATLDVQPGDTKTTLWTDSHNNLFQVLK